ncbi:MAG: bifunctional folylpolyglutamate synthase/dihydrofolate synthase [Deltaproteobacteria bacterium]|nr:bifunctional folylpolyglutamate synthase/dihydrofolate synthase [Deltaproteobacteria bacterium]
MTSAKHADYQTIIARLFELQKFGMKFGLDSMERLLDKLGHPERELKLIHLAGTNGKGSTAAMLTEFLRLSGYKTGLYTSPHLITFRERIQINSEYISEEDVASLSEEIWPATDPDSPPTFFEFVTAMALLHFRRRKTDVAVMETGLGGRLDSTNVISPVLCGITNVGLEHTEHLGATIDLIAKEKAGIIKPGVPFVGGRLTGQALATAEAKAAECQVPKCLLLGRDYRVEIVETAPSGRTVINYAGPKWNLRNLRLALAGSYQADNAAMALAMAETLESTSFPVSPEAAEKGLLSVKWPGRAETFEPESWPPTSPKGKAPLILDGAHNPDGAKALSELLAAVPKKELHLITGVMADKDIGGVLAPVLQLADRLYLTRPAYHRAASPELLLARLTEAAGPPKCPHALFPTIPEALTAAASAAGPSDLVVVCGSLFTVGETRAYLIGSPAVESN